ncbi:MAG: 3-dehydroquinate synthase [Pseudomonadota bacterium]
MTTSPTALGFETVSVDLGARSYEIRIGQGLLRRSGLFIEPLFRGERRRVAIVTDRSVAWRWLETLWGGLSAVGVDADAITLEPGEQTKSMASLETLLDQLLAAKIERGDLVIAFGGGVIGDLAGFAAAVLRRGVRFVQIPTSLLAQVDSSVGGKTGINSPHGKNLIGAMHQPSLVLADVDVLDTLPERELKAGYAEVAKYGLLGDLAFFEWLEKNGALVISGDPEARIHAVKTSCEAKARIVERDETEQGDRALLNLGHTFGHALEAATGYGQRLIHGEAVSIGMGLAFDLSARMGLCAQEEPSRVRAHLAGLGLKTGLDEIAGDLPDADGLMGLMAQDKKVRDGKATFILARGIGQAFRTSEVDPAMVRGLLAEALAARA